MQFLWKYIDDLVGKGLEVGIVTELLFYLSASVVPLALPIAVLLAAIITFGKLGEHYELVAMKASGISLQRILLPLATVALLLSAVAFLFSNYMLPIANLKFGTLLYSVVQQRPVINIKEGVFYDGIEGYILRIGSKNPDNIGINDVMIYDHTSGRGCSNVIVAERGEMVSTEDGKYLRFKLYNGKKYEELSETPQTNYSKKLNREQVRLQFEELEMLIDLSDFGFEKKDENLFKSNHQMMSVAQLRYHLDSLQNDLGKITHGTQERLQPLYSFMKKNFQPATAAPATTDNFAAMLCIEGNAQRSAWFRRAIDEARNAKSTADWARSQQNYLKERTMKYSLTLHKKYSLSFSCFVLFLIGAPLGAIIRKGGLGMPMVVSIIFFMLFHILDTIGKKLAEEFAVGTWQGAWFATFFLLPLAIFLVYKSANDSALFNIDAYKKFFKRIGTWGKKKQNPITYSTPSE